MPNESRSSPREIQNFLGRVSGPLLDRIDLHIEVPQVKFREITDDKPGETSAQVRAQVRARAIAARQRQHARFASKPKIFCNARMGSRELKSFCVIDESTMELLKFAMADLKLSARAYDQPSSLRSHSRSMGQDQSEGKSARPSSLNSLGAPRISPVNGSEQVIDQMAI